MIDSVPLIQNANDAQQINASIIAMKKASRELDEKIVKLNSLNSELDKKIALLDSGLNKEIEDRKEAINSLDVPSVGGSGKYISAISETDGKINATASDLATSVTSGNSQPVTSEAVAEQIEVTKSSDNSPYSQRVNADKDKSFINKLIGASFAINQKVPNGNFASASGWSTGAGTLNVSGNVARVTLNGSAWNNDIRRKMPSVIKGHKFLLMTEHRCSSELNNKNFIFGEVYSNETYCIFSGSTSWTTVEKVFPVNVSSDGNAKRIGLGTAGNNYSGEWFEIKNFNLIDLTQMFGSAIADRIYAMEQATEGSGIAWIKSFGFFNNAYYATDEGSIQSAKPSACRTTGFNIARSWTNGSVSTQYTTALVVDCELRPATTYCIGFKGANNNRLCRNENLFKNDIFQIVANGQYQYYLLTTKDDISSQYNAGLGYVILKNNAGNSVTPNFTQVCVSLADSRFNGQYEKYIGEWNYPFADTELRGIPKLDSNNNLYFDGDVYYPNGDVIRRYGVATMSDFTRNHLNTASGGGLGYIDTSDSVLGEVVAYVVNNFNLPTKNGDAGWNSTEPCIAILGSNNGNRLRIYETLNMTLTQFQTKYANLQIVYKKLTPTSEIVAGYTNPHTLIKKGIEEFVDNRTIPLPTGHETEYVKLPSWLSNNVIFL